MPRQKILLLMTMIIGFLGKRSDAEIVVSDFTLSVNSVSFEITGTLPLVSPGDQPEGLYFVNPDVDAAPGFALGSLIAADSATFSGTQDLRFSPAPIQTGNARFGDYFFVAFESNLSVGESLAGVVTAGWSGMAFDPNAVSLLNVQWGAGIGDVVGNGVQLDTVAVPEPSTLFIFVSVFVSCRIRRR